MILLTCGPVQSASEFGKVASLLSLTNTQLKLTGTGNNLLIGWEKFGPGSRIEISEKKHWFRSVFRLLPIPHISSSCNPESLESIIINPSLVNHYTAQRPEISFPFRISFLSFEIGFIGCSRSTSQAEKCLDELPASAITGQTKRDEMATRPGHFFLWLQMAFP